MLPRPAVSVLEAVRADGVDSRTGVLRGLEFMLVEIPTSLGTSTCSSSVIVGIPAEPSSVTDGFGVTDPEEDGEWSGEDIVISNWWI